MQRWIRGGDDRAAFDWYQSARSLDVPMELARALYVRAMQRAQGLSHAEALYQRWLRDAAAALKPATPPTPPGRQTRVERDARCSSISS